MITSVCMWIWICIWICYAVPPSTLTNLEYRYSYDYPLNLSLEYMCIPVYLFHTVIHTIEYLLIVLEFILTHLHSLFSLTKKIFRTQTQRLEIHQSSMTTLPETDIASLHISKPSTDETANAIPLDGKVTVWRIENFEKVLVKPENVGHFYSGDSYIVLYSYKKRREDGTVKSNEEHIIYFWHGNDSSQDEKGSSAILATMLDDELGGTPIQVMVAQGKEPRHFRALFHGALVVHFGGVASGFKNVDDEGK